MDFHDLTYDGAVTDGRLTGGLGQLTDLELGPANFRLDARNRGRKGYEWVAWRNDSSEAAAAQRGVSIVFHFDQVLHSTVISVLVVVLATRVRLSVCTTSVPGV